MANGIFKLALVSPKLRVADVSFNVDEILNCFEKAAENASGMVVFPALSVTGATCGDLFLHEQLYQSNLQGIKKIVEFTETFASTIVFGAYLKINSGFYDCIFIADSGSIRGIVPKMDSRSSGGISWERWFKSAVDYEELEVTIPELGRDPIPFGNLIFEDPEQKMDVIIKNGSDIFYYNNFIDDDEDQEKSGNSPALVINVTADSTQAGINRRRLEYYKEMSEANKCTYAYVSPGVFESTTDLVFSGQTFTASNGVINSVGPVFERKSAINYTAIELDNLTETNLKDPKHFSYDEFFNGLLENESNPQPFIPEDPEKLDELCQDTFAIQANALATRLLHAKSSKALIGVSGGLDSTLSLLVTVEAFRIIGKDIKDIITVTMPGLGTSDRTYENANALMNLLGTDLREISIVDSVKLHFKEINHNINDKNTAYENAQARERTQILMDMANDVNGLVIGTGDLSESALGWATFGGDHLAMYGVNGSIPKTFIRHILNWIADNRRDYAGNNGNLKDTLMSVIETPISPELLPADEKGQIAQKTEESVGPYELHDYFIYHTMLNKTAPVALLENAKAAFRNKYDEEEIKKYLKIFFKRFFSQQFKRNCSTEVPMATLISLSPRGGLIMPSDAVFDEWINALK